MLQLALERDLVEEADGGDRDEDRARRQLPLLDEMELVGADLGWTQQLGRLAEMTGEPGDLLDVSALGVRREVADPHILDHAMAKRRHGRLLCGMVRARGRDPWSRGRSCQTNRTSFGTETVPVTSRSRRNMLRFVGPFHSRR